MNPIETLILNETERQPSISLGLARVYLNATDPKLATRTWQEVMEHLVAKKKDDSVENSSTAHRSRSAVVSRSCSLPLENGTVLLLARPAERIFSNGVRLEMDLRCRSNIQADFATCHISFVFVFGGGLFRLIMKYMCDTLVLCVGNVMLGFCDSARHHLNHTGLRGGSGNPATRRSPPDSPLIPTQEPLPGAGAGSACCFCSARPPRPGRMERLTP